MAMAAVALPGHENVPGTVSDHAKSRWSLRNCQTRVKGLDDKKQWTLPITQDSHWQKVGGIW